MKCLLAWCLAALCGAGAAFAQLNAYVANINSNSVRIIDVATNTSVGNIPLPAPFNLVVNAAGSRAYVTLGINLVAVLSLPSNAVIATVPTGSTPISLILSPDESRLYVVNRDGGNSVTVIDTATNTVVTTVPIGPAPFGPAITPDGSALWVADANGRVWVIDTATNTVSSSFDTNFPGDPNSMRPTSIAFTPDGALAYLSSNFGAHCVVIDTVTKAVVADIPTGAGPWGSVMTASGSTLYQVNRSGNSVSVIDTATNTVTATVPVGAGPEMIALTPDEAFAYVANSNGNSVSVIATATNTVVATVPVGAFPFGVAVKRAIQVPPDIASANATVTVDEGQTATNNGFFRDLNRDPVTLTASVGTVVNNGNGTWSWSFPTTDGPVQSQTVTITADDGQGGVSSTSFNLVVNNVAPTIVSVSNNGPVFTGSPATITVTATDPAGANDPLAYSFDCNNDGIFEIGPQASNSAACTFASAGSHTVNVRVADDDGGVATGSTVVTVLIPPPNCSNAVASPNLLWPPNHKFVPVQITGVSGASIVSVTSIFQDEPTDAAGDGNTCPDGTGTGTATANLRAERSGVGNGRVYTVAFTATGAGGSCQGSVTVCVPHDNNGSCGNGGALFNSGTCSKAASVPAWTEANHKHGNKSLLCASHLPTLDCDLFCDAGLILCP